MGVRVLAAVGLTPALLAGAFALSTLGVAEAVGAPPPDPVVAGAGAGAGAGEVTTVRGRVPPPPAPMLGLYATAAAGTCPGLPWSVLAAVGTVESDNGRSTAPGVHSGTNYAGAEGPMQFEPATFAEYDRPVPVGGARPPSPYDPVDAVWAAARLLCADGAASGDLAGAVFAYNHSTAYVARVLALAAAYSTGP